MHKESHLVSIPDCGIQRPRSYLVGVVLQRPVEVTTEEGNRLIRVMVGIPSAKKPRETIYATFPENLSAKAMSLTRGQEVHLVGQLEGKMYQTRSGSFIHRSELTVAPLAEDLVVR